MMSFTEESFNTVFKFTIMDTDTITMDTMSISMETGSHMTNVMKTSITITMEISLVSTTTMETVMFMDVMNFKRRFRFFFMMFNLRFCLCHFTCCIKSCFCNGCCYFLCV